MKKMLSISDIFKKDSKECISLNQEIEKEYQGLSKSDYLHQTEYRVSLDSRSKRLKTKLQNKSDKIELYVVGIVFVVLTGLVTNQLYTSSLFSFTDCPLAWGSFFIGHIFVILSFVLLMLFGIEIVKVFMMDDDVRPKEYIILASTISIPVFSQINSALIDINCNENYKQVGFSSIVIGFIIVKYILLDLFKVRKKLLLVFGYKQNEFSYSINNNLSDM